MSDADEAQTLEWLRELKGAGGTELRRRYGAHALGIGRMRDDSKQPGRLALVFYIDPETERRVGIERVPECVEFVPEGATMPVCLATDIVVTPEAAPEGGE